MAAKVTRLVIVSSHDSIDLALQAAGMGQIVDHVAANPTLSHANTRRHFIADREAGLHYSDYLVTDDDRVLVIKTHGVLHLVEVADAEMGGMTGPECEPERHYAMVYLDNAPLFAPHLTDVTIVPCGIKHEDLSSMSEALTAATDRLPIFTNL